MKTIVFVAITFCLLIVGCSTPQRTSAPEKTVRPMDVVTMELRFRNQEDQDFVTSLAKVLHSSGIYSVENKKTEPIVLVLVGQRQVLECFSKVMRQQGKIISEKIIE